MRRSKNPAEKGLTVSLVIPAYNEESHLAACLDAVARQTVKPFEVIVVDNNSSDRTAEIAASYPFVRLVREPRRGVAYARDAGFNAAHGTVIGRIDVDTHLAEDWIALVQRAFAERPELDAVTGTIGFYDVPFERIFTRLELMCRRFVAKNLLRRGEMYLYGGNMALKREAWQRVRGEVCHEAAFHEDMDLGAHFAYSGARIAFDERLRVRISARRVDSAVSDYYPYVMANSRTYLAHGLRGRFYMYPVEAMVTIAYPLLRLLYRSYDAESGKVSLRRAIGRRPAPARVSPVIDTV
jgi:glycosyltransferase involved in cell wall biosynthesis